MRAAPFRGWHAPEGGTAQAKMIAWFNFVVEPCPNDDASLSHLRAYRVHSELTRSGLCVLPSIPIGPDDMPDDRFPWQGRGDRRADILSRRETTC